MEFDVLKSIMSTFKNTFEDMGLEQKRAALRIFIKKVIWDGENVHIYLFGSDDNEIKSPPVPDLGSNEPLGENRK